MCDTGSKASGKHGAFPGSDRVTQALSARMWSQTSSSGLVRNAEFQAPNSSPFLATESELAFSQDLCAPYNVRNTGLVNVPWNRWKSLTISFSCCSGTEKSGGQRQEGAGRNLLGLICPMCKMGAQNTCPTPGWCEGCKQCRSTIQPCA